MKLDMTATIKQLEGEKARIEAAIASLRALNGNGGGGTGAVPGQTVIGAVIAHLRKTKQPQTSAQLRQAIATAGVDATAASIQTILSKRARAKRDLVHKGRGLWGVK